MLDDKRYAELVYAACNRFFDEFKKGKKSEHQIKVQPVVKYINSKFGLDGDDKISREGVYPLLREGVKRQFLILKPPRAESLEKKLRENLNLDEYLKEVKGDVDVVNTRVGNLSGRVNEVAADKIVELIYRVQDEKKKAALENSLKAAVLKADVKKAKKLAITKAVEAEIETTTPFKKEKTRRGAAQREKTKEITREIWEKIDDATKKKLLDASKNEIEIIAKTATAEVKNTIAEIRGLDSSDSTVADVSKNEVGDVVAKIQEKYREVVAQKIDSVRVHIGFGEGYAAEEVAKRLSTRLGVAPKLTLHACTSGGHYKQEQQKVPTTYFSFFEGKVDAEVVGMFAPTVVTREEYDGLKNSASCYEAFNRREEIDILVTSLACFDDEDCLFRKYYSDLAEEKEHCFGEAARQTLATLEKKGCVGDVMFQPYSNEKAINDYGLKMVSLFELADFQAHAQKRNHYVVLTCGPCRICGQSKAAAIYPLLTNPSLRMWTHLIIDRGTAQEILGSEAPDQKTPDHELHDALVFAVCEKFLVSPNQREGERPIKIKDVADSINYEFQLSEENKIKREGVYPLLKEGLARKFLVLAPPGDEKLREELCGQLELEDHIKKVDGAIKVVNALDLDLPNRVNEVAADEIVNLIHSVLKRKRRDKYAEEGKFEAIRNRTQEAIREVLLEKKKDKKKKASKRTSAAAATKTRALSILEDIDGANAGELTEKSRIIIKEEAAKTFANPEWRNSELSSEKRARIIEEKYREIVATTVYNVRVHIGFGAGYAAEEVAKRLATRVGIAPKITLHAFTSGGHFTQGQQKTPTTYFSFFEGKVDAEYVGMFAPTVVHWDDYEALKHSPSCYEAFRSREEIDILVTSLASFADDDSLFRNYYESLASVPNAEFAIEARETLEKLKREKCVGDVMFQPYSNDKAIREYPIRTVSLFELHDFKDFSEKSDRYVVVTCAPCRECGKSKADAVLPLLKNKDLRIWTHLIIDRKTVEEILKSSPSDQKDS
jgi:hypothetical protein